MGWCPNIKTFETEFQINPVNFEAHDRSEGEKADRSGEEKAGSNPSRMRRIGLLLISIGAFVSALTLVLEIQVISTKDEILVSSLMMGIGALLFLIGAVLYIKS